MDGDDDEDDGAPDNFAGSFAGHYAASGVAISADGVNWYPLWNASQQPIGSWQNFQFDLGAAAAAAGIPLGANFQIKLQQFDDGVKDQDGTVWLGQSLDHAGLHDGELVRLQPDRRSIGDARRQGHYGGREPRTARQHGDLLASGSTAGEDADKAITNFIAPTTGTYYARVFGLFSTSYSLVASVAADFDTDANGTLATAQAIGSQQVAGAEHVLGHISSGTDVNVYEVQMNGGTVLQPSTTTPGDGSGQPQNVLDPQVQVFNSAGTLIAADDNSATDGRNAQLSYAVPAGSGGTYYIEVSSSPLTAPPTVGDYVLTVIGANTNHRRS